MANELMSGQEVNSFSQDKEGFVQEISGRHRLGPGPKGDDYNPDALQMYWCNDTPGVVNLQQVSVLALSTLSRSMSWRCQPSAG